MTKHRDVNKCRRKEKCKMAALISGYEMANKPEREKKKKKKKEEKKRRKKERMVEKKRKREKN